MTADDRFWDKVEEGPVPEFRPDLGVCWLWTGAAVKEHGRFWDGEKTVMAYRWLYEQRVGPIPEGLQMDHLCRVPRCVRPTHVEPVTNRENQLRSPISPTFVARQATQCQRGHDFTPANTYWHPRGHRACRTCRRMHWASYKQKVRETAPTSEPEGGST